MHLTKRTAALLGGLAALATAGTVAATAATVPVPIGFSQDRSASLAADINPAKPRNVILLIGDGMDDSIITAARNYEVGAGGRFAALDALPFTGAMTTYGLKVGTDPTDYPIAYVSDSAPTASGWSTGKKTVDSRISQGPSTALEVPGEDYETVLEKFAKAGKRTGNVSTAEITDATPAAAASHINNRACQDPTAMTTCVAAKKSNGGKGSIAEQLVDNEVDVLLGGGAQRYAKATDAGPTVLDYAKTNKGYTVVNDADGLAGVTSVKDGPVLGLFATGNMTPLYKPLVAAAGGAGGATTRCEEADRGTQPDLATMTDKAIKLLDNDKGFFLQVESAMIDKQEHASDICGAIGDVREIDSAIKVALDYQKTNPDTLIIVTGDHSHSTQIVPSATGGKTTATVQAADGDPMTVAYSTSDSGSQTHTGTQIRVAASGPQAANVTGVIDQTDLFATMLGRTPSTLPTTPVPTTAPPTTGVVKPSVSVASAAAIRKRELAGGGLRVAVAAASANQPVTVKVTQGSKVLSTKRLRPTGGAIVIRTGKAKVGTIRITATATGTGGSATFTSTVRVRR